MAEYIPPPELEVYRIPEFVHTVSHLLKLHQQKNKDYATGSNPFSNFDFADLVGRSALEMGCDPTHLPFINHLATKLSRLFVLLNVGHIPNNESIEDSFDDLASYVILWKCRYLRDRDAAKR